MADSSTQSMTIAAAAEDIMAVITDFEAYPAWAKAIKEVEICATDEAERPSRVRFSMDAGLIKDVYELEYRYAPDGLTLHWDLVAGQIQKAQHGSYLLRPAAAADGSVETEVTYTLAVELTIPMIAVLRRKAEKTIMDTALRELRARVLALS